MKVNSKLITIVGPTASGKSSLALELSQKLSGEIVNGDSRQIYQHIPIGTAQPNSKTLLLVPHHLYGFLDPKESFNAGAFAKLARKIILDILARNKTAIVVGGTGLYLQALFDGLSELPPKDDTIRKELREMLEKKGNKYFHEQLERVDPISAKGIPYQNSQRILRALEVYRISGKPISQWHKDSKGEKFSVSPSFFGILWDPTQLKERIRERTVRILPGIIEETKWLKARNYKSTDPGLNSLGYKHCFQFLEGNLTQDQLFNLIYLDTIHYAKRQMTWFKKNPRIKWLEGGISVTLYLRG